ncbi:MAG: helix-hairpin-helix domain-containing protein [Candidatus Thorarchaeota archaeon]
MRYGLGVSIGALLPGIIFMGSAIPKIAGLGVTDQAVLASIWSMYVLWFYICIGIAVVPLLVVYNRSRENFRRFVLFEAGGFGLFSPLWLFLATEMSGTPWTELLFEGIQNGLPAPGPAGTIIGISIGPVFFVPLLIAMLLTGLIVLRPSFIERHGGGVVSPLKPAAKPEPAPAPTPEDTLEAQMPGVKPPVADELSKVELRALLLELGVPEPTIAALANAGYATVTDIVSTSAEQLAISTGLDKATAENLHMAVQKRVWFGGI